jgi:hypothetical protein
MFRAVAVINILCDVASSLIYIGILLGARSILRISILKEKRMPFAVQLVS